MTNVLLTTDSSDLQERVREAAGGHSIALPSSLLAAEPAQLLGHAGQASLPDVLVLDATGAPEDALALAARFDRELPGTGVVLIGDPRTLSLGALRAGVRDVVPSDTGVRELEATIERVAQSAQARRSRPQHFGAVAPVMQTPGRVVTVLSPKGGAGKTTIASNLAVGLAASAPGAVVLVDLDVQFGDVATALALEPEYTLDHIVHGAAVRDPIALKTHLTLHESGVHAICAPESPVDADAVTADDVSALLSLLSSQFRFVVVDTAAGLDARTLAALDHTTDPLLVTTFDVPGARGLRKELTTLRELGMLGASSQVVLNFADPRSGLGVADVESTIRARVDMTIPYSKAVTQSLNIGKPLVHQRPKDPVSKQLGKLLSSYERATAALTSRRDGVPV